MEKNYKIYDRVKIGKDCQIGDFVIIGMPVEGLETIIGDGALIRSHTVIYEGNVIGRNFQTGHGVLIRENNRIGDDVSIGSNSCIEHHIKIEDRVRIHSQVFIAEFSVLEEGCWIGPKVAFTNAYHPLCPKVKECLRGPTIKRGAKIGANSTILPNIIIGEEALVGAGSVVVEDVPPRKVVVGNPARVIKDIKDLTCPYGLIDKPY
jgi:acetyltransferase-like isoleucine patch superfamily enzyme